MYLHLTQVRLTLASLNEFHTNEQIAEQLDALSDALINLPNLLNCDPSVHRDIIRNIEYVSVDGRA
jgi:hypothetical protein